MRLVVGARGPGGAAGAGSRSSGKIVGERFAPGYKRAMEPQRILRIVLVAAALAVAAPAAGRADTSQPAVAAAAPLVVAQAGTTEGGRLQPRYEPAPVEEKGFYDNSYIFSLTRGVANSTLHPAAKAPMFVFTVPLDIVLLPATLIGGFFG